MLPLTDLDPVFVRYETRVETWDVVDGDQDTWNARGRPTKPFTGPKEYAIRVDSLEKAQGLKFQCPACLNKSGHYIDVSFRDRGVLPDQGSQGSDGKPSRWLVSGTGFNDLTIDPSIDCGCWHSYIENGIAK